MKLNDPPQAAPLGEVGEGESHVPRARGVKRRGWGIATVQHRRRWRE